MLLELLLEPLEQREGIGGGAGEPGDDLAVLAEAADLPGVGLHHRVAHRDLAVAGDDGLAALADADDGGAVPLDQAVAGLSSRPWARYGPARARQASDASFDSAQDAAG